MSQSYLKASIDGVNGAGKSGTAVRLAVGISKELCSSAPVLVADTEDRWRFYKRVIFDVEKVPLIILPGKTLIGIQQALVRAENEGCCVFVGDQLTTPWMEGVKSFAYENGLLPFGRRQQLMNEWDPIIERFRYGKFHAICCGRLGYWWENVEDDEGNETLHQGDAKFNAGGSANFGYEADLELTIRRRARRLLALLRWKTAVEHICEVRKDAAGGILNGKQFIWPTQVWPYRPGDYKAEFDCFRPYLDFIAQVEPPPADKSSSRDLLVTGKTPWKQDQDERGKLLEEFSVLLDFCFPGGEGKSKQATMFRNLTVEFLTGSVSWSRMADECSTERLRFNRDVARAMRYRIEKEKEIPTNQDMLNEFLLLCKADVEHPGASMTFTEALLGKTLHKGPQPIAKLLDRQEAAGD